MIPKGYSTKNLTDRELDVALLRAKGCSREECMEVMGISRGAFDVHQGNLYAKFEISNGIQLALWAIKKKLVPGGVKTWREE